MLTSADKQRLSFYSPVSFLRTHQEGLTALESSSLQEDLAKGAIRSSGNGLHVLYRLLDWDTQYFGLPVYRLEFASCPDMLGAESLQTLASAYRTLVTSLAGRHPSFY